MINGHEFVTKILRNDASAKGCSLKLLVQVNISISYSRVYNIYRPVAKRAFTTQRRDSRNADRYALENS
jgi:hypothetical protein